MGIRLSDHPALAAAYARQVAKEKAALPEEPKIMWTMRVNLKGVKPFTSRDPVEFKAVVEKVQEMNPGLKIYIYQTEGL